MSSLMRALRTSAGLILVALFALALVALFGGNAPASRNQTSPLPSATLPDSPVPTSNVPTLTPEPPLPTLTPMPTYEGTRPPKGGPTPLPSPTRPPVMLTPTPEGSPPADLQALYYVADNNGAAELRVIGIDDEGRKWLESQVSSEQLPGSLWGLYPSPDGRYLAVEVASTGDEESIAVYIMEHSSGQIRCLLDEPVGCRGSFWGWISNNQVIFRPINALPGTLRIMWSPVLVNIDTGQYEELDLPSHPNWGYSLVTKMTPSSDGSRLAYSITYTENGEEISEIWTMNTDGTDKQLVHSVKGVLSELAWSPASAQLVYLYQNEPGQFAPSELWLINSDGSGERLLANDVPMPGERRYRPTWSPDGRYIAYVRLDDPVTFYNTLGMPWGSLHVVDVATGNATRLSSFERRDTAFLAWSPNSRFVAFVSTIVTRETSYPELWLASFDGRQLYPIEGIVKRYNALAWWSSATSTPPPIPTPLPSPVITAIATQAPPIIPEVVGKTQQPFWIIYWQDNEIWRVNDQGKEQRLLLDTHQSVGLYLTANPYLEFSLGERVVISPDGQQLALALVDKAELKSKDESAIFSIHLFDMQTGNLKFIHEGWQPVWSPDGKRLAFLNQGALWLADLDSNQTYKYVNVDPEKPEQSIQEVAWSPDGKLLSYRLAESMGTNPEYWIKDTRDQSQQLLLLTATYSMSGFAWSPDGQSLLYRSPDGENGGSVPGDSLWRIVIANGERRQLTNDMTVGNWAWSPDGKWIAFSATRIYERSIYLYDLWLISSDAQRLIRVTSAPPDDFAVHWSPDGTRLAFWRDGVGLVILSLESGESTAVGIDPRFNFTLEGVK